MGKIKVTGCDIEGLYVIEPTVFKDEIFIPANIFYSLCRN